MAAVSQTSLSNAFSWMKILEFLLRFHWSLFLRIELTIFQHWFRWCLGAGQATSHYLNQWWLVYWRIYASLGLNELIAPLTELFPVEHRTPAERTNVQWIFVSIVGHKTNTHELQWHWILCVHPWAKVLGLFLRVQFFASYFHLND